jgi:predicted O-methyltransferase YrrM
MIENKQLAKWADENLQLMSKSSIARYENLKHIVAKFKPKTICEIGTSHGRGSLVLIEEALKHQDNIHFTGYDLFEEQTVENNLKERNGKGVIIGKGRETGKEKPVPTIKSVSTKLNKLKNKLSSKEFEFDLIKGDTNKTLNEGKYYDLAFIDGGHHKDTVINDYNKVKNSRVVVFDDFIMKFNDDGDIGHPSWGAHHILEEDTKYHILPHWYKKQNKETGIGRAIFQMYIVNE